MRCPCVASATGSREDRETIHRCTRLWKHWRALSGKPGSRSTDSQQAKPASMTLLPSSSTPWLALPCTDCLQLPFLPSRSVSPTILPPTLPISFYPSLSLCFYNHPPFASRSLFVRLSLEREFGCTLPSDTVGNLLFSLFSTRTNGVRVLSLASSMHFPAVSMSRGLPPTSFSFLPRFSPPRTPGTTSFPQTSDANASSTHRRRRRDSRPRISKR